MKQFQIAVCLIILGFLSTSAVAQADDDDFMTQKEEGILNGLAYQNAISTNETDSSTKPSSDQNMQAANPPMAKPPENVQPTVAEQKAVVQEDQKDNDNLQEVDNYYREKGCLVFSIAPEVSYIKYHEFVGGSTFMKEKGVMGGINGSATFRPPQNSPLNLGFLDMYRLEGMFSYGQVDYYGSNTFDGINDYMVELRDLFGKDINFNNQSTRLTPYIGVGYRSLFDTLNQDKPTGYNRWIQYLYIPTGAEIMTQLNDGWSIGAGAEYDIFLYGRVSSYLGEVGLGDLTNTQNRGYGLRGSLKLEKQWHRFNFILEPYIRYWHIQNSNVRPSAPFLYNGKYYFVVGQEPDNTSTEVGGKFTVEF